MLVVEAVSVTNNLYNITITSLNNLVHISNRTTDNVEIHKQCMTN